MKYTPRVLLSLILLLGACLASAQNTETHQGHEVKANQVLLRLGSAGSDILQRVSQRGAADDFRALNRTLNIYVLHSGSANVAALLNTFKNDPAVVYIEPDYIVKAVASPPNDPLFSQQWALLNTSNPGADIGATGAWTVSTGGIASVAGVVDTGIDYTHPDLAANVWSAPAPFTVSLSWGSLTCPAGSHGYNSIARSCDPKDDHGHGTHVSGTIGAVGNNAQGVAGVNLAARIMALKFLNSAASGSESDAIDAIEFALQAKTIFGAAANVRVLSNSWGGGGFSQALLDEINHANTADALFVAAAGNNSQNNDVTPTYPAAFNAPNMVTVAATTNTDGLASFSNYGHNTVHLGAPGVNIISTWPNAGYAYLSGTSMATPHVSGAALLVLSACALNTAALKTALLANVDPVAGLSGITTTGGRLNVNKAIHSCANPVSGPPAPFGLSATSVSAAQVVLAWTSGGGSTSGYKVFRNGAQIGVTAANGYTDSTVLPSTGYTYTVSAYNASGQDSPLTAPLTVNTPASAGTGSSIWSSSTVPSIPWYNDAPATLGVEFRSDVSGNVTGIRFYKGAGNNGTHIGLLYSSTGTPLAQATFSGETASGWQQVNFSSAVSIAANTTYIAAFFSTSGFAYTPNYFTSSGTDSPPLHALRSGVDGPNSVYMYGGAPQFPSSTYADANYWVDIAFSAGGGPPPPTATSIWSSSTVPSIPWYNDAPATLGVKFRSDVSGSVTGIRFYKGAGNNGTHIGLLYSSTGTPLAQATFSGETASGWQQVNFSSAVSIAANTTYIAAFFSTSGFAYTVNYFTSSGTDSPPLHALRSGVDGPNSVFMYGGALQFPSSTDRDANYWVDIAFSAGSSPPPTPTSLWSSSTVPSIPWYNDAPVTLGVKFRSDVSGSVTGIRFYKGAGNNGTHIGLLYSSTSTPLAQATFSGETAAGWQQVNFSSAVSIAANTTYIAAFFSPSGFALNTNYFTSSGMDSPPLHALRSGVDGPNSVYVYGAAPQFPSFTYRDSNYWVDLLFTAN